MEVSDLRLEPSSAVFLGNKYDDCFLAVKDGSIPTKDSTFDVQKGIGI
jgi:hypothetical protein